MNRRDFITSLLGAAAAAAVLPALVLEATPVELEQLPAEVFGSSWAAIHRRAYEQYLERMSGFGLSTWTEGADSMLGELAGGILLTNQRSVHMTSREAGRHVDYAIQALTDSASRLGLDTYGQLRTKLPGTYYSANLGPLRMVVAYEIQTDSDFIRFDVLGGSSPAARPIVREFERRQRLVEVERLKGRIRGRLGSYRRLELPA